MQDTHDPWSNIRPCRLKQNYDGGNDIEALVNSNLLKLKVNQLYYSID